MIKIKDLLKKLFNMGFAHVFSASLLSKIISFCSGVFVIRFLTKELYGLYAAAGNVLNLFLTLSGLGVAYGMLQYGSETDNEELRNTYYRYGTKVGVLINTLLGSLIVIYSLFTNIGVEGANDILIWFAAFPLFAVVYNMRVMYLRTSLKNKEYSKVSVFYSGFTLVLVIGGAILFEIKGVVAARYISIFASILLCGYNLNLSKNKDKTTKQTLTSKQKKEFMKFSSVSCISSSLTTLLFLIDVYVVGVVIPDAEVVASYKTATLIPYALDFVPFAVITFVYPYFAKHNKDFEWIKKKTIDLVKYLALANSVISIVLFVGAPLIIRVLFGAQYMDSLIPFRILSLGYFVTSTFRAPSNNIIYMIKRIKFNLYAAIVYGFLNIVLDVAFVKSMGSVGAAIATVSIYVISSIANFIYLFSVLNKNRPETE